MKRIGQSYCSRAVFRQYQRSWMGEKGRIAAGQRPISWDYQMDFTIKAHKLYGVCPCKNQIKNIGVDAFSIHGGTSFDMIMTKRFCGMDSYPLRFPLQHPKEMQIDPVFEKKIGKIILYPLKARITGSVARGVRKLLRVPAGKSTKQYIKEGFR